MVATGLKYFCRRNTSIWGIIVKRRQVNVFGYIPPYGPTAAILCRRHIGESLCVKPDGWTRASPEKAARPCTRRLFLWSAHLNVHQVFISVFSNFAITCWYEGILIDWVRSGLKGTPMWSLEPHGNFVENRWEILFSGTSMTIPNFKPVRASQFVI